MVHRTTLVYLHVAKPNRNNLFSPFDRLTTPLKPFAGRLSINWDDLGV